MRKFTAVAAVAVMLTVGGCGGNKAASTSSTTTAAQPSGAPTTGCTDTATEELYVAKMFTCADRSTLVYLFNDSVARDNYWKVAEAVGSVKVGEGSTWLEVKA